MVVFRIDTRHEGAFGSPDYWATRVNATFTEEDWDATCLMLHDMCKAVGPMLAGDFTRVTILRTRPMTRDLEVWQSWRGRPTRDDPALAQLANACV